MNGTLKLLGFLIVFGGVIGTTAYQVASRPTEERVTKMIDTKQAVTDAKIDGICNRLDKIEKGQSNLANGQQEINKSLNRLIGKLSQ